MLLLTVFLLTVLFLLSYVIFDRDFFAPPTVVSLGMVFATLCCFYNEKKWMLDFSSITTWTIVIGIACFIGGGVLAVLIIHLFRGGKLGFTHNISKLQLIEICISKTILIIVFELLTIVLLFVELRRLTGSVSWYEVVSTYRAQEANVNPEEFTMRLSGICRLAIDFSFAVALIYAYIVGNNIAAKKKQPIINWIPILLSCILSFMQGYRSDMIRLWIAILVVSFTLNKRRVGWRKSREIAKMIRRIVLSIVGIAIVFVALRGTVGRAETDWDPIYYLTFYAGTSIASFDLFLKDPLSPSNIWGKETFYYLNQSIGSWFNKPELRYIFYKEYRRSPSGIYIGNVYTALRPPYYDFGFSGMIIIMLIMGFFFTFFYCKIRNRSGNNPIDFRLLIYSYLAYTFFMYFYNCYNNFLSFGFVRLILELLVFRWFLIDFNIKGRKHRGRFLYESSEDYLGQIL